jgi:hypothetical protein
MTGKLDRQYLRTCTIYRLLKAGKIGQAEANELAARKIRGMFKQGDYLRGTIEIWKAGSLKAMRP